MTASPIARRAEPRLRRPRSMPPGARGRCRGRRSPCPPSARWRRRRRRRSGSAGIPGVRRCRSRPAPPCRSGDQRGQNQYGQHDLERREGGPRSHVQDVEEHLALERSAEFEPQRPRPERRNQKRNSAASSVSDDLAEATPRGQSAGTVQCRGPSAPPSTICRPTRRAASATAPAYCRCRAGQRRKC